MVIVKQIQIALGMYILLILTSHYFGNRCILGGMIYQLQTQAKQDHGNKKQSE